MNAYEQTNRVSVSPPVPSKRFTLDGEEKLLPPQNQSEHDERSIKGSLIVEYVFYPPSEHC